MQPARIYVARLYQWREHRSAIYANRQLLLEVLHWSSTVVQFYFLRIILLPIWSRTLYWPPKSLASSWLRRSSKWFHFFVSRRDCCWSLRRNVADALLGWNRFSRRSSLICNPSSSLCCWGFCWSCDCHILVNSFCWSLFDNRAGFPLTSPVRLKQMHNTRPYSHSCKLFPKTVLGMTCGPKLGLVHYTV